MFTTGYFSYGTLRMLSGEQLDVAGLALPLTACNSCNSCINKRAAAAATAATDSLASQTPRATAGVFARGNILVLNETGALFTCVVSAKAVACNMQQLFAAATAAADSLASQTPRALAGVSARGVVFLFFFVLLLTETGVYVRLPNTTISISSHTQH